ncbi:MAG: hypothetical protein HN730_13880, partial [Bdellovibrionales bacterium]|nr:hypothetical protein [Bdellovibrionales bacterium]
NNASFAAMMTYQSKGERIVKLHQKLACSLPELVAYIEKQHQQYQELDSKDGFADYLFK